MNRSPSCATAEHSRCRWPSCDCTCHGRETRHRDLLPLIGLGAMTFGLLILAGIAVHQAVGLLTHLLVR